MSSFGRAYGIVSNQSLALLSTILILTSTPSCSMIDPHENFVSIMRSQIGMSADDPHSYTGAYHRYRVSEKILDNGNFEEMYKRGAHCRHYFEIDQESRIIVGWRFEGTREECAIVP